MFDSVHILDEIELKVINCLFSKNVNGYGVKPVSVSSVGIFFLTMQLVQNSFL